MKRSSKFLSVLLALTIIFTFLGCNDVLNEPVTGTQPEAKSDLALTYKKLVGLQLSYSQKTIDLVQQYVDLPEQVGRSALGGSQDFSAIGHYLPADLSSLKRPGRGHGAW
jgi:hypothetical protein